MFIVNLRVFYNLNGKDAEGREQAQCAAVPGRERSGVQPHWAEMPGMYLNVYS